MNTMTQMRKRALIEDFKQKAYKNYALTKEVNDVFDKCLNDDSITMEEFQDQLITSLYKSIKIHIQTSIDEANTMRNQLKNKTTVINGLKHKLRISVEAEPETELA